MDAVYQWHGCRRAVMTVDVIKVIKNLKTPHIIWLWMNHRSSIWWNVCRPGAHPVSEIPCCKSRSLSWRLGHWKSFKVSNWKGQSRVSIEADLFYCSYTLRWWWWMMNDDDDDDDLRGSTSGLRLVCCCSAYSRRILTGSDKKRIRQCAWATVRLPPSSQVSPPC